MMRQFLHSTTNKRHGQSLVEFALILPVLLLFIMGTIDFGRALFTYAQASSQLRQALRLAAVIGYDSTPVPPYRDCARIRATAQSVFFAESVDPQIIYLRARSDPAESAWDSVTGVFDEASPNATTCTLGSDGPTDLQNGDVMRVRETVRIRMITPLFPTVLEFTLQGQRSVVTRITLASTEYCGDLICQAEKGELASCPDDCTDAPHIIRFITPSCGSVAPSGSPVPVQIEAQDDDIEDGPGLLNVFFVVNRTTSYLANGSVSSTIYTYNWTPAPGVYLIQASATDNNTPNHTSSTSTCTFTVSNPPTIDSITTDIGLTVPPSVVRKIKITANDTEDPPGKLKVTVAVTRGVLYASTAIWDSIERVYVTDWMPPSSGTADIRATAKDSAGLTAISSNVKVIVNTCGTNCTPYPVEITAPSGGSTVNGTVTVQIDARDEETVPAELEVQVSIDGGTWQNATYSGTGTIYTYDWDTTSVPNGSHNIVARAIDKGSPPLTTTSSAIAVTVNNLTISAPNPVAIIAPSDGSTIAGIVTIQVDARDAETAPVALVVQVSIDGGTWQNATYSGSGTIYRYSWDTKSVTNGSHKIAARAIDDGSPPLTTTSSDIRVTVSNTGNTAPNPVTITSPANGASVSGTVTMQIDALDMETGAAALVVQVSIDGGAYQNATYTGDGTIYTYTWNATGLIGSHTITARATDTGSPPLSTTSNTITVKVNPPISMDIYSITAVPDPLDIYTYYPTVTVIVRDNAGHPVAGVSVSGPWLTQDSMHGTWSCITDASGQCSFTISASVIRQIGITFMVTSVTHATLAYDEALYVPYPPDPVMVYLPPPGL